MLLSDKLMRPQQSNRIVSLVLVCLGWFISCSYISII